MLRILVLILVVTSCTIKKTTRFKFEDFALPAPIEFTQVEFKIINPSLTIKGDTLTFSGKVISDNHIPLPDIGIYLCKKELEEKIDSTNSKGDFQFEIFNMKDKDRILVFASYYTREYHYDLRKIVSQFE
ncbi:MAG: hypothetical protein CFE21_00745 [Bacteroidetes bacterium B1(2017)]|nr:MAG: hypothetical protein CFE21_00745 [Bacteroidetes bacterium B1(2017)]